jgi:hypothetical protein
VGLEELGKRLAAAEMDADGSELLAKATDDVEDECAVGDGLGKTSQGINHGLEALAVLSDGEVALDQGAELGVEKGSLFPIVEEL